MEFTNTKKVFDCAEFEAIEIKHILADGKLSADDFPHLLDMVKNYNKVVEAYNAIPGMKAEIIEMLKSKDPVIFAEALLMLAGDVKEVVNA